MGEGAGAVHRGEGGAVHQESSTLAGRQSRELRLTSQTQRVRLLISVHSCAPQQQTQTHSTAQHTSRQQTTFLSYLQGPLWHVAGQRWLPHLSFRLHTSSHGGHAPSQQRRLTFILLGRVWEGFEKEGWRAGLVVSSTQEEGWQTRRSRAVTAAAPRTTKHVVVG